MPSPATAEARPISLGAGGGRLRRCALRLLDAVTGLAQLQQRYQQLPPCRDAQTFCTAALDNLGISYRIDGGSTAAIPASGPLIIVANHPYGAADGLILTRLLGSVRSDLRVLGNYHLGRIPALAGLLFAVDPFQGDDARRRNLRPLRDSLRWLQQGGALLVFPAGEVAHYQPRRWRVADPHWHDTVGRLALRTRAPVLPVYVQGRNSVCFHLAGLLHPLLRTVLLPRELLRLCNTCINLRLGRPVAPARLKKLPDAAAVTEYLRLCTCGLGSVQASLQAAVRPVAQGQAAIMQPVSAALLRAEVDALPAGQLLLQAGELQVYLARATQIPWTLQEIGRLRELTFRQAGEGSGLAADLDLYDTFYRHLFIWHRETGRVVGAYRLGLVDEIRRHYGVDRLYSRTLFRYPASLLSRLGPAMELGRSFIRPEYQRSHAPLNLLWKGIARVAAAHDVHVLFGPVSISREYTLASRKLIIDCLRKTCYASALARRVRPRYPFRPPLKTAWRHDDLLVVRDMELVSGVIEQMETDAKGLPVLVRQYVKLGGRFLGFNVDPAFSDVVDGLIVVNLLQTETRTLEKYLGASQARRFLARCRDKSTAAAVAGGAG